MDKQQLLAYTRTIGIDLTGVTTPEPFPRYLDELAARAEHYRARYAHRLETWHTHAEPLRLLPGARSVIVIGYYYLVDEPGQQDEPCGRLGRVVSYGHPGIFKRAKLLCAWLQRQGFQAVMGAHRKEAAVRAGLGLIGNNALVCNPQFGQWVAYQSIVTDAPLDPDAPATGDLCGNCRLCLDACPTGALYEPHRLDPRRCVTCLLTSRDVPAEHWPAMGTRILACDACLEACPKNRGLAPRRETDCLLPGGIGTQPPLRRLLGFSEASFQAEFMAPVYRAMTGSTLAGLLMRWPLIRRLRARLRRGAEQMPETFVHASGNLAIYQRNALIAAGNLGDRRLRADVARHADDPYLGPYARWALERLT